MRSSEKNYFTVEIDGNVIGFSVIDTSTDSSLNAVLSIIRTIFVSILLAAGAMLFSKDVEDLVLIPIETMLNKV